uniref:Homeobox domain-containing protein n=1 Tax=Xiphophorus couchianus TaxID=32473 RepID=A0A3B5LAA6_9TELE
MLENLSSNSHGLFLNPYSLTRLPTESSFLSHSASRRPRTHLSCLQLSILQSCYETCAHPNAMECEAIGTELNLPLKVVQIWFQNTRAKEKRWRLQQEKMVRSHQSSQIEKAGLLPPSLFWVCFKAESDPGHVCAVKCYTLETHDDGDSRVLLVSSGLWVLKPRK